MRRLAVIGFLLLAASVGAWADDVGNSPLSATPIETDGTLLTACIDEPGDMDYFLFSATAGRTYRLTTSHPSDDMDSILYLIDRDGEAILAVDDDSAGGTSSRIVWTCHESGIYFIMVRHAQATTGTGCYGLSASVVQLDDYGNDRLSASAISDGQSVSGFLEEPGDIDAFMIPVDQGYEYSITFVSQKSGTPLVLTGLLNGDPEPVVSLTSQGLTQTQEVSSTEADTLFLFVQSESGDHTGSYVLTVSKGGYADDYGNSAEFATLLSAPWTEIQGNLEVPGDVDWFRLEARAQAEYAFVLTSTQESSGLRVAIRGPGGQLLQESATTMAGDSIELTWSAPDSETYYLEVSSTDGAGSYQLRVAATLQLEAVGAFNPSGYSLDVVVNGDKAYLVVGTKGLLILDVSDPTDPFEIGSHTTNGYAQAVAVDGKTAFVAIRSEGVAIIDVSDPSRPLQIGTFDTPGSAHAITVYQDLALISDQQGGLQVARIQSDRSLVGLASVETLGYPTAVAVSGSYAWVAVGDAGLQVFDLSDPEAPESIGHLDLPGDASDVALYGDLAYVAAGYRGVRIVNASDPSSPSELAWISTAGEAAAVSVAGDTLFIAERTEGMSAYSLIDPLDPQLVAQVDTPGEATAMAVAGDFVYIADRQEGMLVVRLLP